MFWAQISTTWDRLNPLKALAEKLMEESAEAGSDNEWTKQY